MKLYKIGPYWVDLEHVQAFTEIRPGRNPDFAILLAFQRDWLSIHFMDILSECSKFENPDFLYLTTNGEWLREHDIWKQNQEFEVYRRAKRKWVEFVGRVEEAKKGLTIIQGG